MRMGRRNGDVVVVEKMRDSVAVGVMMMSRMFGIQMILVGMTCMD